MYAIKISKKAAKFIKSRTKKDKEKIFNAIKLLKKYPSLKELDVKPLKSKRVENLFRIRVGSYRIIFTVYKDVLLISIIDIWNRWEIYKSL